ncbi:Hypothetical predicted protein [Lynx pardinus]|uniref:Uncharacterized protein n=1 Tax=Lynx pardinus TaxID=191816 RepID=A0A485MKE3_LYNPA|nr:Hypothetical predicted protein [Lynx pardinus]
MKATIWEHCTVFSVGGDSDWAVAYRAVSPGRSSQSTWPISITRLAPVGLCGLQPCLGITEPAEQPHFKFGWNISGKRGTTDLPTDWLQIIFHVFLQDSEMKFWKAATLWSHCHRLSAKSTSRWGNSRAMSIIGRMVVRTLLLRSTTCLRRNKFRTVCE